MTFYRTSSVKYIQNWSDDKCKMLVHICVSWRWMTCIQASDYVMYKCFANASVKCPEIVLNTVYSGRIQGMVDILGLDALKTFPGTCKRKFPSNRSCAIIQTNLKCQSCIHWLKSLREKKHALKSTYCHMQLKNITNIDNMYMYPSSAHKIV